ncbi:putative ribonuclease H protein [Sesbania bispinosa]|nr:putative ribonuclease H protein [Sesbania bispinosa]
MPTKDTLMRRHIIDSATSPRCQLTNETTLHCLRDCGEANLLWSRMGLTGHSDFFLADVDQWLRKNSLGAQGVLFLATLWWSWNWRNNRVFSNEHWSIDVVIRNVLTMQDDLEHSSVCDGSNTVAKLWDLLLEIRSLLQRSWNVQICSILREANLVADSLAKLGRFNVNDLEVWDSPPAGISQMLLDDCSL